VQRLWPGLNLSVLFDIGQQFPNDSRIHETADSIMYLRRKFMFITRRYINYQNYVVQNGAMTVDDDGHHMTQLRLYSTLYPKKDPCILPHARSCEQQLQYNAKDP
jgi:hypothetical protein